MINHIGSLILLVALLTNGAEMPVYTEYKTESAEEFLWEELSKYSPSDSLTAAILGYFKRESEYRSDAVTRWAIHNHCRETDICQDFTLEHDTANDTEAFVKAVQGYGGYGLGQWYNETSLTKLYELSKERKLSVGDARLQCEFAVIDILDNEKLCSNLEQFDDAYTLGLIVAHSYDGTHNEGAAVIASYAQMLYDKYAA